MGRYLAGGNEEPARIDYSVLSVGVVTVGLILVVELLRHRIDHAACRGSPFFQGRLGRSVFSVCRATSEHSLAGHNVGLNNGFQRRTH
jgi:hypothetical protein